MQEHGYLTDWPFDLVRIACDRCGRRGQYSKKRLIGVYGILCPVEKAARLTAQFVGGCHRQDCGVYLPDMGTEEAVAGMTQRDARRRIDGKSRS